MCSPPQNVKGRRLDVELGVFRVGFPRDNTGFSAGCCDNSDWVSSSSHFGFLCFFFFGEDSAQPLLGCTRSHPDMVRAGQLLALSSPQVPEQGSAYMGWRPPCWGCWQRPLLGQPQVEGEILWAQPLEPKHPQINPAERRKLMGKSKLMALGKSDRKAEFWGPPRPHPGPSARLTRLWVLPWLESSPCRGFEVVPWGCEPTWSPLAQSRAAP